MTSEDLIPVVSYARISDDGEGDAHGVEDQHKINQQTADRLGYVIVRRYTDNDLSAAKADVVRDDFEAMLKAVKVGKLPDGTAVRGVVALADDRLVRRPGDYERFVDAVTYEDGRVYADQKGFKDLYNEDVEAMGLFGVVISKMEVRKMQRRMRNSHRARAERGKAVGGHRPFGWQEDRVTLHPVEAHHLRRAIEDFIRGKSLSAINRSFVEKGLLTTLGNEWTLRTLKLALWNPRVCGWRKLKGEIVRNSDGAPIVGEWEPIVTPGQWEAVDAIMQARQGHRVNKDLSVGAPIPEDFRTAKYLLTGILRCGKPNPDGHICNTALRVTHHKDCKQHIYTCPHVSAGGCGGLGRRGDLVDEYITEAVLAKFEERNARQAASVGDWDGQEKVERLLAKRATFTRKWQEDEIPDDLYFPTIKDIEGKLKQLQKERRDHALKAQRAHAQIVDIRKYWEELERAEDISMRRSLVFEALHAVIVLPAGKGRKPFNPDLLVPKWRGPE